MNQDDGSFLTHKCEAQGRFFDSSGRYIMAIQTKYGMIEGVRKEGCTVYYGIPFAEPPVGKLAFKHPLPPSPWEGTYAADKGSPNPVQVQAGEFFMRYISRDCLYLNVFVPDGLEGPAPVMVWIYGGSYYQGGSGAERPGSTELIYDMTLFARETRCIVVTLNYRLNVYGFMNFHFLDEDFEQNNGLYDQIQALRFVHETIASFGGDPENVTLFGQSAGAACILALMTMQETSGLFQRTIIQSPCIEHFFTEEESEKYTKKFMQIAGIREPSQLFDLPEETILAAAKKYSSWVLLKAGDLRCAFSPVIDGTTLVREPKTAVRECEMPMLIGSVTEECNLFVNRLPKVVLPLLKVYYHVPMRSGKGDYRQKVSDSLTDYIYNRPITELTENYSGPVWRYLFDYCAPDNPNGRCHICELPVLFGSNAIMGHVDDRKSQEVGKKSRKIWEDFARNADPGWPVRDTFRIS